MEMSFDKLMSNNSDFFKNFKEWKTVLKFLHLVQRSGVVNMFQAGTMLLINRSHLDRYYGEGREDDEYFNEMLDQIDEIRQIMIRGSVKTLEAKNQEISIENVESEMRKNSRILISAYIAMYPYPNKNIGNE